MSVTSSQTYDRPVRIDTSRQRARRERGRLADHRDDAVAFWRGVAESRHQTPEATSPAVVVVAVDLRIVSRTSSADAWLTDLPDPDAGHPELLPTPVQIVVLRALTSSGPGPATVVVRGLSGRWVRVQGWLLAGPTPPQIAVVLDLASPTDLAPIRLAAIGLTAREREIVELVLRGRSTKQIATELFISPYTVQDRLKSIFDKAGVRSRRELVAAMQRADLEPEARDRR